MESNAASSTKEDGVKTYWFEGYRRRTIALAVMIVLFILSLTAGIYFPIDEGFASMLNQEYRRTLQEILGEGITITLAYTIFLRNLPRALVMFVPGFGLVFGLFAAFSTGLVINSLTVFQPEISRGELMIILFTQPYTWLEFLTYGLAGMESVALLYAYLKKRINSEVYTAGLFAILVASMLLLAATLEVLAMQSVQA